MLWQARPGFICGRSSVDGSGALSPSAAFLARTSGLDATHSNAYVALIDGLVADGVWSSLDALWVLATQDETTALLSLVSSTYNATKASTPAFVADRGYTGTNASTTIYLDTHFVPASAPSPKFVQNSAHISVWSVTDVGVQAQGCMGLINTSSGSNTAVYPKFTDNNGYYRINSGGIAGVATASAAGHYISNRSTSSAVQGYKNGASTLTNNAATSVAVVNGGMIMCATNINNTAAGSPHQVAAGSLGSSLSSTDAGNLYSRLRTFMTVVGVP